MLVIGEPKPGQKHRANGKKIAMEIDYECATRSSTFDRVCAKMNHYDGYISGAKFWKDMAEEDEG